MPGVIKLYQESRIEGTKGLKNKAFYYSPNDRKLIIEHWREMYGDSFERMYLQIKPDVVDVIIPSKKVAIQRPPAKYDNQKPLYP